MSNELRPADPSWQAPCGQYPVLTFDDPFARAVHAPGTIVGAAGYKKTHTFDWREPRKTPGNTFKVEAQGSLRRLDSALARTFTTDEHSVGYVLYGPDGRLLNHSPRVAIDSIPWLVANGHSPYTVTFWSDSDNPKVDGVRREWDEELRAESDGWMANVGVLRYATRYFTLRGQRFVIRLGAQIPLAEAKPFIKAVTDELVTCGVRIDLKCLDVTRMMRMPSVTRRDTNQPYQSTITHADAPPMPYDEVVEYLEMGRAAIEQAARKTRPDRVRATSPAPQTTQPAPAPEPVAPKPPREPKPMPTGFDEAPPGVWQWLIDEVGAAIAAGDGFGNYHELGLLISGALWWKKFRPETIPAITASMLVAGGATKFEHHYRTSIDTVSRAVSERDDIAGMPTLLKKYPEIGRAMVSALSRKRKARPKSNLPTADEAYQLTRDALSNRTNLRVRRREDGFPLGLHVRPGVGKTRATIEYAVEMNRRDRSAEKPKEYVPTEFRVGISVPRHDLAVDLTDQLRALGVPVERMYSPARAPEDKACKYPRFAAAIAASGASMVFDGCQGRGKRKCPELDNNCEAALGRDADPRAVVRVVTHARIREAESFVGIEGLLVIDEPDQLIETLAPLTYQDISTAISYRKIDDRYRLAMEPVMICLERWVEHAEKSLVQPHATITEVVREAMDLMSLVDDSAWRARADSRGIPHALTGDLADVLVSMASGAIKNDDDVRARSCPVNPDSLREARSNTPYGEKESKLIGTVVRVYNAVFQAARAEVLARDDSAMPHAFWRLKTDKGKSARVKRVKDSYYRVLKGEHARRVVLLDGNMEVHEPVVRLISENFRSVQLYARDETKVTRVHHVTRASRALLFDIEGDPRWPEVERLLVSAARFLQSKPRANRAAIVTFKPLALALADALGVLDDAQREMLKDIPASFTAGMPQVVAAMRAVYSGELHVGHFGALRGSNKWKDLDALVTVGDPRPDPTDVRRDMGAIGLPEETFDERYDQLVRSELEQVHERLRGARRPTESKLMHVGTVRPGGIAWDDVEIMLDGEDVSVDHAQIRAKVSVCIRHLGSVRCVANALGVTCRSVYRWLQDPDHIGAEMLEKLQQLAQSPQQRPLA